MNKQRTAAAATTDQKAVRSLVLTDAGRISNTTTNRNRIIRMGKLIDSGHRAGSDGRAWEDYLLGDWDNGQIIRVTFPSFHLRGEVELMMESRWDGWVHLRAEYENVN
jgi:hypothetical protein